MQLCASVQNSGGHVGTTSHLSNRRMTVSYELKTHSTNIYLIFLCVTSVFSISEKDDSVPIVKGEGTTQVKSTRWNHIAWVQNPAL